MGELPEVFFVLALVFDSLVSEKSSYLILLCCLPPQPRKPSQISLLSGLARCLWRTLQRPQLPMTWKNFLRQSQSHCPWLAISTRASALCWWHLLRLSQQPWRRSKGLSLMAVHSTWTTGTASLVKVGSPSREAHLEVQTPYLWMSDWNLLYMK